MWGIIAKHDVWRADREAEGARLLSEYRTKSYLGFESPALRQTIQTQPKQFGWVFLFFAGKSIKTQSIPKSLKFSLDAVPHQWHFNYCDAALPQLDRGSDYESERHRFESYTPHQNLRGPERGLFLIGRNRQQKTRPRREGRSSQANPEGFQVIFGRRKNLTNPSSCRDVSCKSSATCI